jgi:hypothetical protein
MGSGKNGRLHVLERTERELLGTVCYQGILLELYGPPETVEKDVSSIFENCLGTNPTMTFILDPSFQLRRV